ncbi:hypothetical protein IL306_007238 [Fusarium sp. DS 682]|nr:hypothetical protein IL306_007238 [Fusarium sp. DS 682]
MISRMADSPISPLSEKSPQDSTFNSFDGQEATVVKTFSGNDGHHGSSNRRVSSLDSEELSGLAKRRLSSRTSKEIHAYMEHRESPLINGFSSAPGYWPSYDALCYGKDPRDPSSIQKEGNFARSPSSDIVFNNSVIREALGTRKVYRTGESEYLVHWAGYPRGQLSWVSQDIIQPIAEHQIMFFGYERRLLCYKGPHGEIFTRKDAPQCEEGQEEGCVGCARCG